MDTTLPLLFAGVVGFSHAFEADHLVAVSNIVTKRKSLYAAVKDGIYWGLGHTMTIFIIGLIIIVGKATFLYGYFSYFEGIVGVMLIMIGIYRLYTYYTHRDHSHSEESHDHRYALGVGLIHGLAGSGAMVLLVMTEIQSQLSSMIYLIIFGIGSVVGMLVAAGLFSFPFSKKITTNKQLQLALVIISSVLCIGYGGYVMYENIIA